MLDEMREGPERPKRLHMDSSKLTANLRLFGLLALLVPIFAGLQYIVREGVPRVEVRLVAQDAQTTVPVERVVERVVYVPVGAETAVQPTERIEPARSILASAPQTTERSNVRVGGLPSAEVANREPEPAAAPPGSAEATQEEAAPLMGTVALAPPAPAPVAAPVVAARQAAPVAPWVYQAPAEDLASDESEGAEVVAEAEPSDMAPDEDEAVAEAADGPTEEVAVIQSSSDEPAVRDDEGPTIAMLRHELYTREARPQAAPEPTAEEPAAIAADEEPAPAPEAEMAGEPEEAAGEPEELAAEPQAEQPMAEGDEPVSEANPVSSEELLSTAPNVTTEAADHGANTPESHGTLGHQLAARPAGPAPTSPVQEEASGPEEEAPVAVEEAEEAVRPEVAAIEEPEQADQPEVAADEDVEQAEIAETDVGAGADEQPIAETGGGEPEVARVEEEAEVAEEPEQ